MKPFGKGDERLREIKNTDPSGQLLSQFDYTYDTGGRVTTWNRQFAGADLTNLNPPFHPDSYNFTYDNGDQLLAASQTDQTNSSVISRYAYNYDAMGNWISSQFNSTLASYTTNSANQLTGSSGGGPMRFEGTLTQYATVYVNGQSGSTDPNSLNFVAYANLAPGTDTVAVTATNPNNLSTTKTYQVTVPTVPAQSYQYDLNGNLVNDGAHTYQWDAAGNLIAINYAGTSNSTTFTYDGMGRRTSIVEKTGSTVTSNKKFVWEGTTILSSTESVTGISKQFYGGGEQDNGTSHYITSDHLGSTREFTDSTGAVNARYDYDPYGNPTKISGAANVDADFQYAGYYRHANSGLDLTVYRAYNPSLGRWLSQDPIGEAGGMNMYGYALGNPISGTDPLGLSVGGFVTGAAVGIGVGMLVAAAAPAAVVGALVSAVLVGIIGCAAGNLAQQLYENGGSLRCVNWNQVADNGMLGGLFGIAGLALSPILEPIFGMLGGVLGDAVRDLLSLFESEAGIEAEEEIAEAEAACQLPGGNCFLPGTLVDEEGGKKPIEEVALGDRVATSDQQHQLDTTEVDPASWHSVHLRMPNPDGSRDELQIALLRSSQWLQAEHCVTGGQIWLETSELGVSGWATVDSVEPCPTIQSGHGRVVVATITHLNGYVLRLHFAATDETLSPTATHKLYSETRHGWVAAADLQIGELLKTRDGTIKIASIENISGAHRVYNLEVETDHRYFVGPDDVLSHNASTCGGSLLERYLNESGGRWGAPLHAFKTIQLLPHMKMHVTRLQAPVVHLKSGFPRLAVEQRVELSWILRRKMQLPSYEFKP